MSRFDEVFERYMIVGIRHISVVISRQVLLGKAAIESQLGNYPNEEAFVPVPNFRA